MDQGQRNPGGSSPRQASGALRNEESSSRHTASRQTASDEREIERARHRAKAFQDRIQEGDEGQGEWESSARSW